MKAYIVTYLIAAVILSAMFIGIFATILVFTHFLTWSLPTVFPYIMLRLSVIAGLITAIFFIRSPEGKQDIRSVEAMWK
jgi:hypothetical protein